VVQAVNNGAAEAVWAGILDGGERGDFGTEGLEDGPRGVLAAIVDDDEFVGDAGAGECVVNGEERGREGRFLVAGREDDGEKRKRGGSHFRSRIFNHGWTRMNTDKTGYKNAGERILVRVGRCSTVVKKSAAGVGAGADIEVWEKEERERGRRKMPVRAGR
jgi:hypothetical protein